MARMLRHIVTGAGPYVACRCRQCRTSDRRGVDSSARRKNRAREKARLLRVIDEYR